MSESNMEKERKLSKKKLVNLGITALLVFVFAFFGYSVVTQSQDISRLKNQKAEYSAKYDAQKKSNKELQAILNSKDKDGYIEQKAREKGYVRSDEIVFYDISASE